MGVDVAGGADVAVAKPLLDVLERYAVGIEKRCAGMSQIMETYVPHAVFLEEFRKRLCQMRRLDPMTRRIEIDVILVVFTVLSSEQGTIFLLLFFQVIEQSLERRNKRKTAVRGMRFRTISCDFHKLAIDESLCYKPLA